jgi:hypothetical protein
MAFGCTTPGLAGSVIARRHIRLFRRRERALRPLAHSAGGGGQHALSLRVGQVGLVARPSVLAPSRGFAAVVRTPDLLASTPRTNCSTADDSMRGQMDRGHFSGARFLFRRVQVGQDCLSTSFDGVSRQIQAFMHTCRHRRYLCGGRFRFL